MQFIGPAWFRPGWTSLNGEEIPSVDVSETKHLSCIIDHDGHALPLITPLAVIGNSWQWSVVLALCRCRLEYGMAIANYKFSIMTNGVVNCVVC